MTGATHLKATWPQIREAVRKRIGDLNYNAWIKHAHLIALDEDLLELGVAGHFFADWIEAKYEQQILAAVGEVTGYKPRLKLSISGYLFRKMREQQQEILDDVKSEKGDAPASGNAAGASGGKSATTPASSSSTATTGATAPRPATAKRKTGSGRQPAAQRSQIFPLQPRFTLDNFVVGASNRLAYNTARQICRHPQSDKRNPFFVHGPSGVGKTHLLQGIAQQLLVERPDLAVLYVPCEYFLNKFVVSLKDNTTDVFRQTFRNLDVLLIDDIQQLTGKKATQDEFLHTFNELQDRGRQLVVASEVPLRGLQKVSQQLISRFQGGLVTEMNLPDLTTRAEIIKRRLAGRSGLDSPDIVSYLADKLKGDVREMEGHLNKLVMFASLYPDRITRDLVAEALDELVEFDQRTIRLDEVENEVVKLLGVTSTDLHSESRKRDIAYARQVCMYLARNLTDFSLNEIGRYFGGKNHATVVFSEKKIRERMDADSATREQVDNLTRSLRNARTGSGANNNGKS
ncbi:MAG: chromosomal replication initiator protein DnaA [Planctomycetota bacterium]